jgi:hypothetical protein
MNNNIRKRFEKIQKEFKSLGKRHAVYFIPGVYFILLGLVTCIAPTLVIGLIAGCFVFCGITLCFLAWKFILFKKKVVRVLSEFNNGRVVIRAVDMPSQEEEDPYAEGKKIVFH